MQESRTEKLKEETKKKIQNYQLEIDILIPFIDRKSKQKNSNHIENLKKLSTQQN